MVDVASVLVARESETLEKRATAELLLPDPGVAEARRLLGLPPKPAPENDEVDENSARPH